MGGSRYQFRLPADRSQHMANSIELAPGLLVVVLEFDALHRGSAGSHRGRRLSELEVWSRNRLLGHFRHCHAREFETGSIDCSGCAV